jgi:hypothetical protein
MMRSAMRTNVRPGDWSDLIYVKTAGLFRGPSAAVYHGAHYSQAAWPAPAAVRFRTTRLQFT